MTARKEKRAARGNENGVPVLQKRKAGTPLHTAKKGLLFWRCYSIINPVTNKPVCRNGRRCGLKIRWWQHRVGSRPTTGTTSEWTTLHSKSPAIRLGFSHTAPSFLLFPTKFCGANFCGGPALRAKKDFYLFTVHYSLFTDRCVQAPAKRSGLSFVLQVWHPCTFSYCFVSCKKALRSAKYVL